MYRSRRWTANVVSRFSVFAGQNVKVKEVDEKVWLISFMDFDLGFVDHESPRFECAENPFAVKVLPMSSV